MDFDKYFKSQLDFFLESCDYKKIKMDDGHEFDQKVNLESLDTINIIKINDGITIYLTRIVRFKPKCLFRIKIITGLNLTFAENIDEDIDWTSNEIIEEIKKEPPIFFVNLAATASLIISQLTSTFGETPLVSPPNLLKK